MKLKHYSLAPLAALLLTLSGRADTINWSGDLTDDKFFNQAGVGGLPLDGSYWFELGTFGSGFTPTSANVGSWAANWHIADRASSDASIDPNQQWNPGSPVGTLPILSASVAVDGHTGLTSKFGELNSAAAQLDAKYLNNDGLTGYDFTDQATPGFKQKAYIWVFNDRTIGPSSYWGLFTSTSPVWEFPEHDPSLAPCNCAPLNFYLSQTDVSVLGPPPTAPGPGTTLVLIPVPEPGSAILILAAGIILLIKRRRLLVA